MPNAAKAVPQLQVQCRDRVRIFCFNMFAYAELEAHMEEVTGKSGYNILKDFDWGELHVNVRNAMKVIWAGFAEDARRDDEPWTQEKCKSVVDGIGFDQCIALIQEAYVRGEPEEKSLGSSKKKKVTQRKTIRKKKARARKAVR